MEVCTVPLDTRPSGRGVISADSDLSFISGFTKGWMVTLRHNDLRIQAQVLDVDSDQVYLGQVTDLEGYLESGFRDLRIGTYLRFRDEHIFGCHRG